MYLEVRLRKNWNVNWHEFHVTRSFLENSIKHHFQQE